MMHKYNILLVTVICFLSIKVFADTDQFSGSYTASDEDALFLLEINKQSDGNYAGTFLVDGETFPITARLNGQQLNGEIDEYGDRYPFVATLTTEGNLRLIDDEDDEYIFIRQSNSDGSNTSSQITASNKSVIINRKTLSAKKLQSLEQTYKTPIQAGEYWYDVVTGAWGYVNGPTVGFIQAGLDLPGPMPADISGGGTNIFINGREIHPMDQQGLQQLFGVTYAGRYWMDAQGNLGPEGGPVIANVFLAIQQAQSKQNGGGSVTHGYGTTGARGTVGGGMYSGRTATGKSVFWYPGM